MVTKLFVACAAIVLFGITSEASAQYRRGGYGYGYGQHHHPYYQQQPQQQRSAFGGYGGYPQRQNEYQLPPGVSVQEAEWVCKNPKTGDMLIVSSEDLPAGAGNRGQPQQPNNPQPNLPPIYPQQPTFSQPPPIYPTQSPPQPSTEAPNTNGDGLIDIRALE